jgi:citrate lyase subunit beta/citryl-CoA lyase
MVQNASIYLADSIIFDLEDSISVTEKDAARILLKNFLEKSFEINYEVIVRVNSISVIDGILDLETIISDKIDAIMLPKASVRLVNKLADLLSNFEAARKINKRISIIPIVELASSLIEVEVMATLDRVSGILLGAEDLTSDMEIERTLKGNEIMYPRSRIAVSCKAAKIDAIDTPFTDVTDELNLLNDASLAKSLGFTAKAAIHPSQVNVINEMFSPSKKQIKNALRIVEAAKVNLGVFTLDGKMIDKPIIERAEKIIEKARKFNLL